MTPTTISASDLIDHAGQPIGAPFGTAGRTVVYFMRTADCPACKKHISELIERAADFEQQDTHVLVVVPDGVDAARDLHDSLNPPFPIATSSAFHDAVGLQEKVLGKIRQSGVFLVDHTGTVIYSRAATLPPMSMKINELTSAVNSATSDG